MKLPKELEKEVKDEVLKQLKERLGNDIDINDSEISVFTTAKLDLFIEDE